MPGTLISMSEIMRVAPWSLRALGHPFGTAERATRLLAWTQAAIGHGLDLLRAGEAAIAASNRLPPPQRTGDHLTGRRIRAGGRNLFEIGPPAIDLATCDARLHGQGEVVVDGAIGSLLVPSLASLAGRRGLSAILVYRPVTGDVRLDGWADEGWVAVVRRGEAMAYFGGPLDRLPAMTACLPCLAGKALAFAEAGAGAGLAIFAGVAQADGRAPALATIDHDERVARAYREGLEVPAEDLAHLYALERITWAPTSERSRKQAGY